MARFSADSQAQGLKADQHAFRDPRQYLGRAVRTPEPPILGGIRYAPFLSLASAIFLATTLSVGNATPANAQSRICGNYHTLSEKLSSEFGERIVASGLAPRGRAYIEVWASDTSGTWSMVTVFPNGLSCLTSAGRDFQIRPAKLTRRDAPAI